MKKGQAVGPCGENIKRISALFDALKHAGRSGTYMTALMTSANDNLEEGLRIKDLSYLHFLVFGRVKPRTGTRVGSYLSGIIEPVPEMPGNVRFVRLRSNARKKTFMRHLRSGGRPLAS
jgi:hypothetical protein